SATEEQVLRLFLGLACGEPLRRSVFDLLESDQRAFLSGLSQVAADAGTATANAAINANIGTQTFAAIVAGTRVLTNALKLRLLIVTLCTPRQIEIANLFLEAAGHYILRLPDSQDRRHSA